MTSSPNPDAPRLASRWTRTAAADIPTLFAGDVVVVGGGSAGAAAALAAARTGARTLLIEQSGFLGGSAVAVLDTAYGFFPPGSDERVVGGIGWELAEELIDERQAFLRPNSYGAGTGVTYEPEALKTAWDRRLNTARVAIALHTVVTGTVVEDDRLCGVIVHTRSGTFRVDASAFVDASGDAFVAWSVGCALERAATDRRVQPLTTTFRVGGVSADVPGARLRELMADAASSGQYVLPRTEGSAHRTVLPGVRHTNMTRVSGIDPTDPWAISAAEIEGRAQSLEYMRFLRERVPGYEQAYLLSTSIWIGTRESRRLIGAYLLTEQDVLEARGFADAIARCGAPVEDHDAGEATVWRYVGDSDQPSGRVYGVPYRCLVPNEVDGLLVAGRCLSATHTAHASARSIAQCLAYGQAAGTAAALAVSNATSVREVSVVQLRAKLVADGALL